jgi:hypothetical protein
LAGATTQFEQPTLVLGGALSIVQDILTILADLGITGVLTALMTNDWSLKAAVTVPVVDKKGDPLQIPPKPDPSPDIKFDDTEIKVEWDVAPTSDVATFSMGGQPMFAIHVIPNVYVTAIVKFQLQVSTTDGTDYSLLIGLGLSYSLDADPFSFKGTFALTFAGVLGDSVLGFAIGFLLQLQASIDPIISVTLSLEGQLALVEACLGTANQTAYGAAVLTLSIEVSLCLVFSISFELQTTASKALAGPDGSTCPLPDVLPNAS